jgi:hypothetical protein
MGIKVRHTLNAGQTNLVGVAHVIKDVLMLTIEVNPNGIVAGIHLQNYSG